MTSFLALAAALAIFDLIMLEIGLEAPDSPGAVSACFFESFSAGAAGAAGAAAGVALASAAGAGAAGAGVGAGAGVAAGVAVVA